MQRRTFLSSVAAGLASLAGFRRRKQQPTAEEPTDLTICRCQALLLPTGWTATIDDVPFEAHPRPDRNGLLLGGFSIGRKL